MDPVNSAPNTEAPVPGATSKPPWSSRAFVMVIVGIVGLLLALTLPAFEPSTTHDATVASSTSSTSRSGAGRERTRWAVELRLDDGRMVTSDSAPLGRGVSGGEQVTVELTNFTATVKSATWRDGEFAYSRTVALLIGLPLAAFFALVLANILKGSWRSERGEASLQTVLTVVGFGVAMAWPFLT